MSERVLVQLLAAGLAAHAQPRAEPRSLAHIDDHLLADAFERAARVQLTGLAARGARALGVPDVVSHADQALSQARSHAALFGAIAAEVSELLDRAGVAHVVFKGVASDQAYLGGCGLRGTTDVDLLVDDLERARMALAAVLTGAPLEQRRPRLGGTKNGETWPVRVLGVPLALDVHKRWLAPPAFADDTAAVLARRVLVRGVLPRPSDEDYAAYLGGNLVQDRFSGRLKLAVDAWALLQRGLAWPLVVERARRWRTSAGLWAVVRFAERHFGASLADVDLGAIRPPGWRRAVLRASAAGAPLPSLVTRTLESDSLAHGMQHLAVHAPARALDWLLDERPHRSS